MYIYFFVYFNLLINKIGNNIFIINLLKINNYKTFNYLFTKNKTQKLFCFINKLIPENNFLLFLIWFEVGQLKLNILDENNL